jgi:hypothetical protein
MGLMFSPDWLNHPDRALPALEQTRDGGFGTILGFVRHMHHTVAHEHVRRAVRRTAENCHRLGLKFALDMDWAHWVDEYVELYPEMAQWTAVRGAAPCFDGRFELNMPYPGLPSVQVAEITAAYGVTETGERMAFEVAALGIVRRSYNSQYALPSLDDDHAYDYHRPGCGAYYTLGLTGAVEPRFRSVILYVSFMDMSKADVAHPRYLQVQRDVLQSYADAGLDGVGWDEPGKGGTFAGWKCGAGFFDFFLQCHGYELRVRLGDLDDGDSETAIQTRRDYHDALNEMNAQAQQAFNEQAQALFGQNCFRGTHHTYSGLGVDIRCGCVDYFRLGRNLSHAFTDTGWEQGPFGETFLHFALAEGLRKELDKPGAYCNDWSRTPRVKWYDYFTRVKSLYGVDWFAIFIGNGFNERFSLFPDDPYWKDVARNATGLNRLAAWLGEGAEPVSDTAVWFGWESLAMLSDRQSYLLRLFQGSLNNLAQTALDSGRFFDFVSDRALGEARIEDGTLLINNRPYKRLVMPYAVILRPEVWAVLEKVARAGIPVVFYGAPPWKTTDGRDLTRAFAELTGVAPVSFADYLRWFESKKPVPKTSEWEPVRVDFSYPVKPLGKTAFRRDAENEALAVGEPATGPAWLVGVDPWNRADLAPYLGEPPWDGLDLHHHGRAHLRVLRTPQSDGHAILLAASMDQTLDDTVTLGDETVKLDSGAWAALRVRAGKLEPTVIELRQDCG